MSLSLYSTRLHNAFYPQDPSFPLTLLHVLSAPLHGLANAFVFGLDKEWWSLLSPTGLQVHKLNTHKQTCGFISQIRHIIDTMYSFAPVLLQWSKCPLKLHFRKFSIILNA